MIKNLDELISTVADMMRYVVALESLPGYATMARMRLQRELHEVRKRREVLYERVVSSIKKGETDGVSDD